MVNRFRLRQAGRKAVTSRKNIVSFSLKNRRLRCPVGTISFRNTILPCCRSTRPANLMRRDNACNACPNHTDRVAFGDLHIHGRCLLRLPRWASLLRIGNSLHDRFENPISRGDHTWQNPFDLTRVFLPLARGRRSQCQSRMR